ncbi:MAG TPA: chloride channel protein, partial [Caldimonas sp.]|nr:chloride channel protein [Caldimonas sp.]
GPLFPLDTPPPTVVACLSCIVAGLAAGALSATLTGALYRIEDAFAKLPVHWMWWPAIGGIVVGIGGYYEPRAFGVGYDVIGDLLQQHLALGVVAGLLVAKTVMWSVALGSGTSGGVLAPLLMIGAGLGSLMGPWLPGDSPQLWALVCMAAVLGGTMRAPLTAVVFAFGLTHDANAFLPTILACAVAYGFTVIVMPRSILTEKIARRGNHVFREYGVDPLEKNFVGDVMTDEPIVIDGGLTVAAALAQHFGPAQRHRAYPVVVEGRWRGLVDRAFLQGLPAQALEKPLADVMTPAQDEAFALPTETCRSVAARMAALGVERLAVLDPDDRKLLVGVVSRSDLLKPSRQLYEDEFRRERLLGRRARGVRGASRGKLGVDTGGGTPPGPAA